MSNLKNLVPPIELCRKIPAGEFADSAMIWGEISGHEPQLYSSKAKLGKMFEVCPAPTIVEILDKCKDIPGVLNPTLWWQGTWKADCAINKSDKLIEGCLEDADFNDLDIVETQDDNAAAAAIRLWLKLKGIEV